MNERVNGVAHGLGDRLMGEVVEASILVLDVLAASWLSSVATSPCGYTLTPARARRAPSISDAWFSASEKIIASASAPSALRVARLAM